MHNEIQSIMIHRKYGDDKATLTLDSPDYGTWINDGQTYVVIKGDRKLYFPAGSIHQVNVDFKPEEEEA